MPSADPARRPIVVLLVLVLASAMANAGSSLLSACLPLIKAEFGFSDTRLGLLTGYASALTFAALTLPIAAWARRWGNSRVFGACLVVYSLANAATASCSAFWQFLAARFGSGLGPASEFPLGQAIVTDHYPPDKRSGALAVYSAGYFLGITGGLALGGYLATTLGWRNAFLILGVAGLATALLQVFLARDRPAAFQERSVAAPVAAGSLGALRELMRNPTYLHITLGYGWSSFATFGLVQWMPSFYNRQFHLPPEQAAAFFGGAYAAGALIGLLAGGAIGNRVGAARTKRLLAFCMTSFALTFPLIAGVLFAPNLQFAFVAHVLATFMGAIPSGPVLAMIHNELPREHRVLGASVFLLALTLLGAGGGPLIIGILSDTLASGLGAASLQWSMLAVKLIGLLLFLHLGYAWWRVRRDRAAVA